MYEQPSFPLPPDGMTEETTGRYVVTFRDEATTAGLATLRKKTSIKKVMSAADFKESAMDASQLERTAAVVFPTLGVAVVKLPVDERDAAIAETSEDSTILAIEPERVFYAIEEALPLMYLRGFRDAVNHLYEKTSRGEIEEDLEAAAAVFLDDAQSTWGLKATGVISSNHTGKGIRIAVLDTGLDLQHPDFVGRSIRSRSFVSGEPVQDGHSHGTHCIGTACGDKDKNGRRYGIGREVRIFVGKVLSNAGSGSTAGNPGRNGVGRGQQMPSDLHVFRKHISNFVTSIRKCG